MRLVVISDSHGDRWRLFDAIENEPTADYIYFLGDGYKELELALDTFGDKHKFISVKGNCDLGCTAPLKDIRTINGVKIYATHGHGERVKYGTYNLEYEAEKENCQLVLYGHTHQSDILYKEGVHYFNPGSLHDGFYGVVDITEGGIICIKKNI